MAKCGRRRDIWLWFAASVALVWLPHVVVAADLAERVVIVYNAEDPESRPLADYYAQKRGVPTNQICGIDIRVSETISRQEYNEKIRDPVGRFLTRAGLLEQEPQTIMDPVLGKIPGLRTVSAKVSYLVLMYGVPLRIENDPAVGEKLPDKAPPEFRRNEASVESELATLPTIGLQISGFLRNPFFGDPTGSFGASLNRQMLLVGRLDGPDPQTVRRMIDDALTTERYGLQGRAYFDWRGIQEKGYVQADDWIRGAYRIFREAGYECDFDDQPETFDEDYPMTDAAIYAGWYAQNVVGPFLRPDFRFKTGAVAYHLHSFSGSSVRTRTTFWVGPLLAKGAAATMGNVFEPYVSFTPHIDMFFQRLVDGAPFLEAGYFSEPALSWQTTFVGDPLYRPFATSVDQQIERLEADHKPDVEWAYLRKVNLLVAQDDSTKAEDLCRRKAESLPSEILYEKLGDLLHAGHRNTEAIRAYGKADETQVDPYRHIRVATKMATAYEAARQLAQALAVYEGLAAAYPTNHNVLGFYKRARELAGAMGNEAKGKSLQAKIDELMAARQKAAGPVPDKPGEQEKK
ncbi:MAG TPA: TIGR03790 family protein [Verrucomicrobiae bacterium]|nr:TIGR03790 family protein [Verrucomicrobiae bacterium]